MKLDISNHIKPAATTTKAHIQSVSPTTYKTATLCLSLLNSHALRELIATSMPPKSPQTSGDKTTKPNKSHLHPPVSLCKPSPAICSKSDTKRSPRV
ncbi:hypothetical protein BU25DRAFT_109176 [Macroventuria anomochaeta]|uniref:Uncharacterized protein n=1 Tax=Macroventuria anomochaeta TaxID=301207 RepID=A0ACB6RUV8_9PLEO|nr:uncharacterized protein BU25DRAFT_109176 [Macroventuria anomochaeta]KAF2625706.1 hypothetical protein BU25DRAFT_109176 [Macroventuria anomochaeta]